MGRLSFNRINRKRVSNKLEKDEYFVEKIVGRRTKNGITEYKVKWEGFDHHWDSWEGEHNIFCKTLIREFEEGTLLDSSASESEQREQNEEEEGEGDELNNTKKNSASKKRDCIENENENENENDQNVSVSDGNVIRRNPIRSTRGKKRRVLYETNSEESSSEESDSDRTNTTPQSNKRRNSTKGNEGSLKKRRSVESVESSSCEEGSDSDDSSENSFPRRNHRIHRKKTSSESSSSDTTITLQKKRNRVSVGNTKKTFQKSTSGVLPKEFEEDGGEIKENIDFFWKFVYERQMIWVKRNQGLEKEEWTTDPLLEKIFIGNMYRELDKGTIYLHDQIKLLKQRKMVTPKIIVRMATIYRLINNQKTFEDFGGIPHNMLEFEKFEEFLEERNETGERIFTDGHQNNGFRRYFISIQDLEQKMDKVLENLDETETCVNSLREVFGLGPFFSQQVTDDLLEEGVCKGSENEWIQLGPGAMTAIRIMWPAIAPNRYLEKAMYLQCNQRKAWKDLGLNFPFWQGKEITLKNIEHCLCEFQKYYTAKQNMDSGKPLTCKKYKYQKV